MAFFSGFRRRHPRLVRSVLVVATFLVTFAVGLLYAGWALVCRDDACPSIDVLED